jgi:hypothetical protein
LWDTTSFSTVLNKNCKVFVYGQWQLDGTYRVITLTFFNSLKANRLNVICEVRKSTHRVVTVRCEVWNCTHSITTMRCEVRNCTHSITTVRCEVRNCKHSKTILVHILCFNYPENCKTYSESELGVKCVFHFYFQLAHHSGH